MRKVKGVRGLIVFVLLAVFAISYTLISGNKPLLGLDLQGGVSVVLVPKEAVEPDVLQQAIDIMNQRVNALGVAEPEISQQGSNILVQIPGVKEQDRAIELVGQTAELQFRPVLANLPPQSATPDTTPGSSIPGDPGSTVPGQVPTSDQVPPNQAPSADLTPSSSVAPTPEAPTTAPLDTTSEQGLAPLGGSGLAEGEFALGAQDPTPSTIGPTADGTPTTAGAATGAPASPDTTVDIPLAEPLAPGESVPVPGAGATDPSAATNPLTGAPTTTATDAQTYPQIDDATGEEIARYQLGDVLLTGSALEGASATIGQKGEWEVYPVFKPGADGIDLFNTAASQCFNKQPTCPTGQLAVVLDDRVITAPSINAASFSRDQIVISGSFTADSARDVATALRYGALPVELVRQSSQIVSASIGEDALRAGLIAGLVGLVLVSIYMLAFYRILGIVALLKLAVEGALLWSIIAFLGEQVGLALTLAGVTGIIVSIGISLDSNVVYYEHLREDIRNGRSVRSATDRSFEGAFSTILKADGASFLGAVLLYMLAVGAVRGFAFYLGLSTLLDVFGAYFFMRPMVSLVTRSKMCRSHPAWFGLPPDAFDEERSSTAPAGAGRPSKRRPGSVSPAGSGAVG